MHRVRPLLDEIFYLGSRSPILAFSKVTKLLQQYNTSNKQEKIAILQHISKVYHPEESNVRREIEKQSTTNFIDNCERIHASTEPQYADLFRLIGRQSNGVRSLVHLRADLLKFLPEFNSKDSAAYAKRMSNNLRDLLATWFTTGLLDVQRVTWESPCEIVQRISEYEAVHPVRTWTDLKRRLGPYRRCFAYTHHMMPNDPLVILHVALMDDISDSIQTILTRVSTASADNSNENPSLINSAIFYSISSTQPGLKGIELGNSLIKRCVRQLQVEHPQLEKFSSLSPIPEFRQWLMEELHSSSTTLISSETRSWLQSLFSTSTWHLDEKILEELRPILMRLCAYYLTQVKHPRTGYVRDPVANFHLRNGAIIWRLNWLADRSERGWKQSCSLMVNYRYYGFDKIDQNSIEYIDQRTIQIDEQVSELINEKRI